MRKKDDIPKLIERSRREDRAAFATLVTRFQPLVFRLAFRLLCDEDEAKDATQETFVKVWMALEEYNPDYRFSTWLYRIASNTCYDRLRSLSRSPETGDALPDLPAEEADAETRLANKQLKELILRYTSELPPRQRLIFTLRDVEELEVSEVREITGLSPGKIKSLLYLARKRIRERINQIDSSL